MKTKIKDKKHGEIELLKCIRITTMLSIKNRDIIVLPKQETFLVHISIKNLNSSSPEDEYKVVMFPLLNKMIKPSELLKVPDFIQCYKQLKKEISKENRQIKKFERKLTDSDKLLLEVYDG